jgi:hypothetical protein
VSGGSPAESPSRPLARGRLALAAAWAAPVAYAAGIYFLSSRSSLPALPFRGADKLVHAAEYAGLAFLLARALLASGLRLARAAVLAALLAALFGATDELHQVAVPNRDADPLDLVADAIGAAAGAAAAAVGLRGRRARASIRG